jgi:hypothetical protein
VKRNKSEARNPNFETNSNDRNRKFKGLMMLFRKFGHLDLGFVSDFDIRVSNFSRTTEA